MKTKNIFCILLILTFSNCSDAEQDCSLKIFHFGSEEYHATGCLKDGLEDGEWTFSDANDSIIQKGVYEKGFKVGLWHYPRNNNDSILTWKKYEKLGRKLSFSMPSPLSIVEEDSSYIKFSNKDSSNIFSIVLSVIPLEKINRNVEDYHLQGEEEIKANNWAFVSKRTKIVTLQGDLYLNEYVVQVGKGEEFNILNAYILINERKLFETSCRFNKNIEASARIIFFSALANNFYEGSRMINPFDEIKIVPAR